MKKIIGILLAVTMLLTACPSMLAAENTDITWFEPIELKVERIVVDNNLVKLVLNSTADFQFGELTENSLKGTKIKGVFTPKAGSKVEDAIDINVQVTGTGTAGTGNNIKTTLLFDRFDKLVEATGAYSLYPSSYSLRLYPADKVTKRNFKPFAISSVSLLGSNSTRVRIVPAAEQVYPVDVTAESALKDCIVNGTIKSIDGTINVTLKDVPIYESKKRDNDPRINIDLTSTDAVNTATVDVSKGVSAYTYDLTISPAPYDMTAFASYVAAEGTEAEDGAFSQSHVRNGGNVTSVESTGDDTTISTGFAGSLPGGAAEGGYLNWEIKLPASGSYIKGAPDENGIYPLNSWIGANTGAAAAGEIRGINNFVVSGENTDYLTIELERSIPSIESDNVICGIIINDIYAPNAAASVGYSTESSNRFVNIDFAE